MTIAQTCALCSKHAQLERSHWVPKFAGDWLKKNSATGYLRNGVNPNVRQQDIARARLLCGSCERRLSIWEGAFAKRIFMPFHDHGRTSFEYEDWLLRFAVSLAWRTVVRTADRFQREHAALTPHVTKALGTWRTFLLHDGTDPGPYEHHMFFFPNVIAEAKGIPYPEGLNAYCLSAVDSTLASSEAAAYAYTLLPGIAFWVGVHPPTVDGWEGTLIGRAGTISTPQSILQPGFADFLLERATWMRGRMAGVSERQHALIQRSVKDNLERSLQSKSFAIHLAEQHWRERN